MSPAPSKRDLLKKAATSVLLAVLLVASVLLGGCGGATGTIADRASSPVPVPTDTAADVQQRDPEGPEAPLWRYVNSGWVSPIGVSQTSALAEELRAFVLTNQDDLNAFERGFAMKSSRGTANSLGRVDFNESILIAAYYLWRPLQGDPLSVVGFSLDGADAEVMLELEDSPQGKEYPLLYAPMTMVAVERAMFPSGEPVRFHFHLNGEPEAEVIVTLD